VLQSVAPVAGGSRLTMTAHSFALAPASKQFYIVATPVSYECNPVTQTLTRYWGYPIAAAQPAAFVGATTAPLATGVSACTFRYTPTGGVGSGGVLSMWMRFTRAAGGSGALESVEAHAEFGVREAR
jgi:MSHA biogenesis protein MshO